MALPEYLTHYREISCAIKPCQSPRRAWRRGDAHSPEFRTLSCDGAFSAPRRRTPNSLKSKGFRLQEVPFVPATFFSLFQHCHLFQPLRANRPLGERRRNRPRRHSSVAGRGRLAMECRTSRCGSDHESCINRRAAGARDTARGADRMSGLKQKDLQFQQSQGSGVGIGRHETPVRHRSRGWLSRGRRHDRRPVAGKGSKKRGG